MKILEKLYKIEKQKCIYNIHYCKAGVGFIFYYQEKDNGKDWKTGLSVEKYYSTFEKAVEEEYKKFKG